MGTSAWIAIIVSALVALSAWLLYRRLYSDAYSRTRLDKAQGDFRLCRERLELIFYQIASSTGKPRGLRWTGCDFEDSVAYARDRQSGAISAFVGVEIRFEAIPGGGMEEVEAVGNVRLATAVFRLHKRQWTTDGRAIFNLNPAEAIQHFRRTLVMVGQEDAHASDH